ncbi:MAG: hypothetical protein WB660_19300 [Candidatus Sulfotelmatobacter sp.]
MAGAVTVQPPVVCWNVTGTKRAFILKKCVAEPVRISTALVIVAPSGVATEKFWSYEIWAGA